MAIHKTVFTSADGRVRVTATPNGEVFTVEKDRAFYSRVATLGRLELVLADLGLRFEDLIED